MDSPAELEEACLHWNVPWVGEAQQPTTAHFKKGKKKKKKTKEIEKEIEKEGNQNA